ncbi:MAG: transketolase C-terminal domain-containing protein [Candidatus Omnitrophota bacterium]
MSAKKIRDNLRDVYVETLIGLAKKDRRIVILDADSKEATKTFPFAKKFPERSFSFGISEQNMVSAAGGMASCGLKPYVNTYSMFIAMRALDQLRNSVAYPNLDVAFVASHHGLDVGSDGVTHQTVEDVAIMRTIPNMKILIPADASEMRQMIIYTAARKGPFYIKSGKSKVPVVHSKNYKWKIGVPSIVAEGKEIAILSCGVMVEKALNARVCLLKDGIAEPRVINVSTIKPLRSDVLLKALKDISLIVTCEDHSVYGGLGGLVAELMSLKDPKRIHRIGLGDTFAEAGDPDKLFRKYRMDENEICRIITSYIAKG